MGDYTDLPPEQRPGYQPAQSGMPGVQFAAPLQPTFTPHAQWGYNAPTETQQLKYTTDSTTTWPQPKGSFKYAEMNPSQIRYTAKPVVETKPPPVAHSSHNRSPSGQFPPPPPAGYPVSTQPAQAPYPAATAQPQFPPPPTQPYPAERGFDQVPPPPMGAPPPQQHFPPPPPSAPQGRAYAEGAVIKEITPGGRGGPPKSPTLRPRGRSTNGSRPEAVLRAPSPGLGPRMNRLSVSGNRPDIRTITPSGGMPPPSPLLEAYRGTYQSMPSPMLRPLDDDLDDLQPLSPRGSTAHVYTRERSSSFNTRERSSSFRGGSPPRKGVLKKEKEKKKVSMYDAETDARDIADELSRSHPKMQILIDILPALTHDQILELRAEYKRVCKIQGRGVNIAKHIKLKTSGNFCKIAYVTALGRWESEGYWANFWYQSNSARRELLIEALMGRTNAEIRLIKDGFKDKRYNDSLTKCMDKELKADKFRVAVLTALEERKQEENDVWPIEYRNKDVDTLYDALRRRDGGESAILNIVVTRSNAHLKEVLRTYERKYGGNFAKDALRKSNNLVVCFVKGPTSEYLLIQREQGEVIAHILNGVINRPARDAMLLNHALVDLAPQSKPETSPRSSRDNVNPRSSRDKVSSTDRKDRYELLISRLVRLHWERMHMMRVKDDYREKYGRYLEEDVEDYVRGEDLREFCLGLCEGPR
jgi:Annexin